MPQRIQLSRRSGWRKPDGAVVVSRPSRWGNAFKVNQKMLWTPQLVVDMYAEFLNDHPDLVAAARVALAGKDLACWCRLDAPCHADVLLRVANGGEPRG